MAGGLAKYQLEYRLGGGGMAEVFIAHTLGAEGFSRRVAIKRVLGGFSDNPAFAKMFVEEARISSRLQHPNIVSVMDFDRDPDGRLFLVMELVEGKDLDGLMSFALLPFAVAIFVTTEILRGLGYAHDLPVTAGQQGGMRGIIHRDVSPHNVLLSWEGAVKVSDFGIAKARSASEATASEFIKGKPAYMSPEQANGERLDGRSDLFAVGIMLWEMLCGRRLFVGEDTRTTLAAVLFGQIPRPRAVRPDVPKDLERVCMKLLERDMPQRYRTAEEAISDLLECHDAPKTGREQLIALMSERFVHEAPVRQARSKPGPSRPPPIQRGNVYDPTLQGHVTPMASVGAFRSAETGTILPPPSSGMSIGAKAAIAMIALGIGGVGAFFAVRASSSSAGNAPVVTAPRDAAADAAVVASVAIDAAPAPPVDAAIMAAVVDAPPPVDAAVAETKPPSKPVETQPVKQVKTGPENKPSGEKKYGFLRVTAWPTLTVSLDGNSLGDTPVKGYKLQTGKHQLALLNGSGQTENLVIEIQEDQTFKVERGK
ncbi:MAG TPA: serine/threonine-protein kinase [Kofleriaceae bacterium]|jgi:serine/threonine-protein kinase